MPQVNLAVKPVRVSHWYNILGQLSLLPSAEWKMSTSQSAVMLCHWGVKAAMAHSNCGWTCGWQVRLC